MIIRDYYITVNTAQPGTSLPLAVVAVAAAEVASLFWETSMRLKLSELHPLTHCKPSLDAFVRQPPAQSRICCPHRLRQFSDESWLLTWATSAISIISTPTWAAESEMSFPPIFSCNWKNINLGNYVRCSLSHTQRHIYIYRAHVVINWLTFGTHDTYFLSSQTLSYVHVRVVNSMFRWTRQSKFKISWRNTVCYYYSDVKLVVIQYLDKVYTCDKAVMNQDRSKVTPLKCKNNKIICVHTWCISSYDRLILN